MAKNVGRRVTRMVDWRWRFNRWVDRRIKEDVEGVIHGSKTLGDPLSDFVTQALKKYDHEAIQRWMRLQQTLRNKKGELILICSCREHPRLPELQVDLVIGVIDSGCLVVSNDSCYIGLDRAVVHAPHFHAADSTQPVPEQNYWELHHGILNLNLAQYGRRCPSSAPWDWSLPLRQIVPGSSIFESPIWPTVKYELDVAIGRAAVDSWLTMQGAQLLPPLCGESHFLRHGFELLERSLPPKTAEHFAQVGAVV